MRAWARVLLPVLVSAAGCVPTWSDDPALVAGPRILAITAEPPEAAPGSAVTLTAVVAGPEGPAAPGLEWAFCNTPRPLSENGPVDRDCATGPLPPAAPPAPSILANLPVEACRLFGPETPPRVGDRPPQRPRDPDPTGGYYQPVRAAGAGPVAFGAVRILCNLASAPLEAAVELRRRYRPNQNPRGAEISAVLDGQAVPLDAVPIDRSIELVARWSEEAAEVYLAFDPTAQALRERREAVRVSWYVTAGTIVPQKTGRAETDPATTVSTTWRPPPDARPGQPTFLWAVFRDSRGGVSAEHREIIPASAPGRRISGSP